jgi:hypothetical protein
VRLITVQVDESKTQYQQNKLYPLLLLGSIHCGQKPEMAATDLSTGCQAY